MANPTTNFGWVMPTSTDLVTDLPADFAVFGQGVDTTLADLKGGTTGQVLTKASNTDMDFTWAADQSGIPATILDAKGDLIAASAADTAARLAVGTNGQVLAADSTAATGLKWTTLPTAKVLQVVVGTYATETSNSSNAYADTGLTATITPSATTSKILVMVNQPYSLYRSTGTAYLYGYLKLLRGSTGIAGDASNDNTLRIPIASAVNDIYYRSAFSLVFQDSPATTSATTYKMQAKNETSQNITTQWNTTISSIILMEIGA